MLLFILSFCWVGLACAAAILIPTACISISIYNLYLHPLSRFRGPKSWAATRVPYMLSMQSGDLVHRIREHHGKYGDFVRVGPNEISYIDSAAWHDIYGHRNGAHCFGKNPIWMSRPNATAHSILSAGDDDHHRIRKLLSSSFSGPALIAQEPLIQKYVGILIQRLRQQLEAGWGDTTLDMVKWYNWTTFDIIGDLAFGETFGCLTEVQYHSWVTMVFSHFKAASFLTSIKFIPFLEHVIRLWPPKVLRLRQNHYSLSQDKIQRRLKRLAEEEEPTSHLLSNTIVNEMSIPEIEATFNTMIIAGSETTASALAGIIGYLLNCPQVFHRLTSEIRAEFQDETDITLDRVTQLPYLSAVLEEGLRLAPPVPGGLPRVVPEGGEFVCGEWLPGGTHVSFCQLAAYRSPSKFSNPESFLPDRWLESADNGISVSDDAKTLFQPFSFGPRDCIGRRLAYAEMRLILARIIWDFDLSLTSEPSPKHFDWASQKTYVLWEKQPLLVNLRKRERAGD